MGRAGVRLAETLTCAGLLCVLGTPQCQDGGGNQAVCVSAASHAGGPKLPGQPHVHRRADQGNHKCVFAPGRRVEAHFINVGDR